MSQRPHLWQVALRRLGSSLLTLLIIAYLTLFGLIMAERGREGLPAEPLGAAGQALLRTVDYLVAHPTIYRWHRYDLSALGLVAVTLGRSAGLLLMSLGVAVSAGVPLGISVASARRRGGSLLVLLSVLGVSTPSFLLAMLLWVANLQLNRWFDTPTLPPRGFGWDAHLVMPVLVLAARPLAQIAQVTYVSFSQVLEADYIRVAHAKGLARRVVTVRHALRNVLIPILITLGTSLRFSLASLPVVEYFFIWPGVGLSLLEAIEQGMTPLVTDLIVSLGLLFLLINLVLELIYPLLDPRLRSGGQDEELQDRQSWREQWEEWLAGLATWWHDVRSSVAQAGPVRRLRGERGEGDTSRPALTESQAVGEKPAALHRSPMPPHVLLVRDVLGNPALVIGSLLLIALVGLVLFGSHLSSANAYEMHGVMVIEGVIGAPPYRPSSTFPWGTDHLGRDVQALVLTGARQTLSLALFGMVARVLLGTLLGMAAGWWRGSWLDRLVSGAVGVWAAFPTTLFAAILIQALGVQQGLGVFVLAVCVVGWGEVAQFVRGQVVSIRPQLYIEAARAVGASSLHILTQHVLPNLLVTLMVLAVLETGGVLMLLAELGFLNVFLGGGFRVMYAEAANMVPVVAYFSDVPEWGALLANIRDWWRSCPWMAWYPGAAFFLAIIAFNVLGEGLRRFLAESRVNVNRLFNRYTLVAAVAVAAGLVWLLQSTAPIGVYQSQARQFDTQRALKHIQLLASPEFQGRETGTPGAERAAEYIAQQMEEIGLLPAGQDDSFTQTTSCFLAHLAQTPILEILDETGQVADALTYRQDFVAYAGHNGVFGQAQGAIVGLSTGPLPGDTAPESVADYGVLLLQGDVYGLRNYELRDKVIIVREAEMGRVNSTLAAGMLVVSDKPLTFERKYLYGRQIYTQRPPVMFITPQVAERLLATAGSSLAELEQASASLAAGQVAVSGPGAQVRLQTVLAGGFHTHMTLEGAEPDSYHTVIGFIPGSGSFMPSGQGRGLDSQVIMVSAYYDGVGTGLDGQLYPGANDNASGVAAMLEIARALKQGPYAPKKTVVFVAWPGGQRYESLSVVNVMGAKTGFHSLTVEAVIELAGVGAGSGGGIALGPGTSYRLVQLFQAAAARMGVSTTSRGRGPHYGVYAQLPHGGRSALSAYVSWDGSDQTAYTLADTVEAVDPQKLKKVGQTTLLAVTVLSRETDY
ncbi:MAG: ABC transporter permease subunit [Thermoflexales bacterium]|nr:ABC transporter permease subunit [Thermoflexales bacterium]